MLVFPWESFGNTSWYQLNHSVLLLRESWLYSVTFFITYRDWNHLHYSIHVHKFRDVTRWKSLEMIVNNKACFILGIHESNHVVLLKENCMKFITFQMPHMDFLQDIIREHEEAMTHKIEICLGCNKFFFGKTMQWKSLVFSCCVTMKKKGRESSCLWGYLHFFSL